MKDVKNMSKEERDKKLNELKVELIKSKATSSKASTGSSKIKEIKKIIARINSLNTQ